MSAAEWYVKITFPTKPGFTETLFTEQHALDRVYELHTKFGGYVTYDHNTHTYVIHPEREVPR